MARDWLSSNRTWALANSRRILGSGTHAQHLASWLRDLDGPLEFFTPAFAQKAAQDVAKFKVGDIEVIQMYDGIWEKAHDEKFIKNATLDETKAALKAGGLTDAHVPIPFTVTAIRTKGKLVLFDS